MRKLLFFLVIAAVLLACPEPGFSQNAPDTLAHSSFVDNRGHPLPTNPDNIAHKFFEGLAEYQIGRKDVLEITTAEGGGRKTERARVLANGTISFSILNDIPVADLSLSEAVRTLRDSLALYIRKPQVQVEVVDYLSKSVSVFGAINTSISLTGARSGPGEYPLKGRTKALEQIILAGGPTSDARLDQVRLIRAGRTFVINLQRALSEDDNSQNVILEHGDVIQVPSISLADRRVAVLGEVREPGVFNLSTEANMLEAIAASEGFTQEASANRIRLIRRTDLNNPDIITVNAERILRGDLSQNIALLDGDILVVPRDWLTDLNDLLGELSPILNWGGLVVTDPLLSVGGYEVSDPVPRIFNNSPTGGTAQATLPIPNTPATQQVIDQVQQNLRRKPTTR